MRTNDEEGAPATDFADIELLEGDSMLHALQFSVLCSRWPAVTEFLRDGTHDRSALKEDLGAQRTREIMSHTLHFFHFFAGKSFEEQQEKWQLPAHFGNTIDAVKHLEDKIEDLVKLIVELGVGPTIMEDVHRFRRMALEPLGSSRAAIRYEDWTKCKNTLLHF